MMKNRKTKWTEKKMELDEMTTWKKVETKETKWYGCMNRLHNGLL